jgi:hypothetical protein
LFIGAAVTTLAYSVARGAPSDVVTYDFLAKQMTVHGLYVPKEGDVKTGLAAELEARQNGIAALGNHIGKVCEGGTANAMLAANWRQSLRSQGSEIFSNGVLKIILTASLKDVYKPFGSSKVKSLKGADGGNIVFRLPTLPQSVISCGAVKADILGKTFLAAPVLVGKEDGMKKVKLLLGGGGVLKVSSPEDNALLENAKFLESLQTDEADVVALPVVGG